MPGDDPVPVAEGLVPRAAAAALGCVPVLVAVGLGAGVERATGVPTVVAGLVMLTVALVANPRLLDVVQPAADLLLRLLPALFVPLVAGVAGVGGDVRSAWPSALAAIVVSVPVGFLVTARLATARRPRGARPGNHPEPGEPG